MKNKLLFITLLACFNGWAQIISQYIETNSGTTPKGIEIWNNTGSTLNFSTNNLIIQQGTNGAAVSTVVTINTGTLVSGGVIVIGTPDIGTYLTGQGLTVVFTSYSFNYNGNDALLVKYGSTTTDVFGTPGSDPGSSWTGGTVSTANQNISILPGITTGATAWTNPSLRFSTISTLPSTLPAGLAGFGIPPSTSTTYTTSWSNSAPTSSIDAIIDGDLTTGADLACKDLTINANRTLTIAAGNKLTVSGNLINNGTIVFKSDATATAMFDVFNGTQSGTGVVTTERYIPARRAFRFLSPSVTTSTSIKLNWQENAGTTAGLGTHITGVDGTTNGFDATSTNNPSLFTFNNSTGVWEAVTSTLTNFTAGTPYRLMVRGDRLINLSTNTSTATETVLRATGTLHTGNFSPTLNQAVEGFSFVGNPYQAPLDIEAVLNAATNMNTGVAYYWDPTLNARGGYVARNLTTNSNDVTSNFNEFLQPGQAVFVKKANTASAASVTITESHKSVANGAAGVFRTTTPNDYGLLRVNLQVNTNNQWQTIEGTLALFNNNFSWNVTPEDATKMSNLDEEVSFVQNNTSLAIACVSAPSVTSELPIQMNNLRHSNYQWQFELANYQSERPYLYDTQNNTYTEITNGATVPFTATTAAANRFKIVFQNSTLGIDDFTNGLVVYPNPAKAGDSFYVQGSSAAQVTVYNVLGQHIPVQVKAQGNALQVTPAQTLSQGIYLVTVTTEGKTQHVKWIVE
jgi:hypothetical protein